MACAGCGIAFEGEYCPDCGTPAGLAVPVKRDRSLISLRCCAYLIDGIAGAVISFGLSWLAVDGVVLSGVALGTWWLLRDIRAVPASVSSALKVVRQDGSPAGLQQRMLRNVTLVACPLFTLIPLGGVCAPRRGHLRTPRRSRLRAGASRTPWQSYREYQGRSQVARLL
jgi:uncharacterized RDD family membrane protein YckC